MTRVSLALDHLHARHIRLELNEPSRVDLDYTIHSISNGNEPTTQTSKNLKKRVAKRNPRLELKKRKRNQEERSGVNIV
jgi:hypothetical protein